MEGCTGWRFVVEELAAAGITALLAEPARPRRLRGPQEARENRQDRFPAPSGCWWPTAGYRCRGSRPGRSCELRALLPLYRDLAEEHTAWTQRIHATLFHQGVPSLAGRLGDPQVRARLADGAGMGLSPAGAQAVAVALRRMDDLEAELGPVHARITAFARRQAGCKTLARELFGVGPLVAAIVWAFLGDARRFSSSAQAVRHTGLDVTVQSSDGKGPPGYLSHRARRSCAFRPHSPCPVVPVSQLACPARGCPSHVVP